MNKIDKLFARIEALKTAHPDMIWEHHCVPGPWNDERTRIALKCWCPDHYSNWPICPGDPRQVCRLASYIPLVEGVYTVTGCARKVTELEGLVWERYDAMAAKARAERAKCLEEIKAATPLAG